jgi:hypothetical protein
MQNNYYYQMYANMYPNMNMSQPQMYGHPMGGMPNQPHMNQGMYMPYEQFSQGETPVNMNSQNINN